MNKFIPSGRSVVKISTSFAFFATLMFHFPAALHSQIKSKVDWETHFLSLNGQREPILNNNNANEAGDFAWNAHYWLRAYLSMAQTYGDTSYLAKASRLIDFMLEQRDDRRFARGELDLQKEPYYYAPLDYLRDRSAAAPGWRLFAFGSEWRVQTLDDGQITNAILRFVDLVKSDSLFSPYGARADRYLQEAEETVRAHHSLFKFNRSAAVPGSYYYPIPDGSGLYNGAVPFNHSATMGVSLLLLDKIYGGKTPYGEMARALVDYFKRHARITTKDGYDWNYLLHNPDVVSDAGISSEDFEHASIDVGFLFLAHLQGMGMDKNDMVRLANTLTRNIYLGYGQMAWTVSGQGMDSRKKYWSIAVNWIDLAEFHHVILDVANEIYSMYYSQPGWSQPFLGWAELLRWKKKTTTTSAHTANADVVMAGFSLQPGYPNPFNASTLVSFDLPAASHVRVAVYSTAGTLVRILLDARRGPGRHAVAWDGEDQQQQPVASGVYFVHLRTNAATARTKITLLR